MVKKLLKGFLWLVGLVLAVGLGLMAYFFIMGRDITPSDDSDLRIVAPPVPDSENTYVAFLAVTNLYTLSGDDASVCTSYRQWRRDGVANAMIAHTNEWRATIDRVLAAHAPYFAVGSIGYPAIGVSRCSPALRVSCCWRRRPARC